MFKRLSSAFSSLYNNFSSRISSLLSSGKLDDAYLEQLERLLIESDAGILTTQKIISQLKKSVSDEPKKELERILTSLLEHSNYQSTHEVILLVGINGGGKTTSCAKLAHLLKQNNKKILLAAADTFRAAAVDQLKLWSDRLQIPLVMGLPQQDPSAVVYQACVEYKNNGFDTLIIDTAGRLQTKTHLMKELEKIHRTINKQLPEAKITTLLVIDSMLGQNSFEQAKIFNESTKLDGVILTKTDGTGKGGIIFNIVDALNIPIAYITFGEQFDDIAPFNKKTFVEKLLHS